LSGVLFLCVNCACFGQSLDTLASLDLPHYPRIARSARIEGKVAIEIEVNVEGKIISANAIEGHPLLKEYALRNVNTWRFEPVKDGKQYDVKITVIYEFKMSGDPSKPFERVSFEGNTVLDEASPFPIETVTTD
jgi:TonB family protein